MHLVFLLEEESMEAFLQVLLPRLLPEACSHETHTFQGKRDLKRKLEARLRGYARWLPENWRIFVLVDRDGDDCKELKDEFGDMARRAGRILQRHGYFTNGLRKTEAARAVAEYIDPAENRSGSFSVFHRTLMEVIPADAG